MSSGFKSGSHWGFSLGNELVFIKTNSIFGITGEEMGHFFSSRFFVKKVLKGFYQYKEICVEGKHGTKLSHAQYVKWISTWELLLG